MDPFFSAASDWAEMNEIPISFRRLRGYEGNDEWLAVMPHRDALGTFDVTVELFHPKKRKEGDETIEEYNDRIDKAFGTALIAARKKRIGAMQSRVRDTPFAPATLLPTRDWLGSAKNATTQANQIKKYWATRGHIVKTQVEAKPSKDGLTTIYSVRSDMVAGLPKALAPATV